ncbi:MAG: hypothetical protein AB7P02_01510 [Alphaproteobacteria bacterium]
MPTRPARVCSSCGATVVSGETCRCRIERAAAYNRARGSARRRGYNAQWDRARAEFLADPRNKFCICGCGKIADTIDHHPPHKGDIAAFWDRSRWRPMTWSCHSRKTASIDGGFGNPIRPERASPWLGRERIENRSDGGANRAGVSRAMSSLGGLGGRREPA